MKQSNNYSPVLGQGNFKYKKIDLSVDGEIEQNESKDWYTYLENLPYINKNIVHYGGYLEKRFFYSNKELFGEGQTRREYHLGIDLWLPEHTKIHAPSDCLVHSVAYNKSDLDYGFTVILKHNIRNQIFYTLYGHLSSWNINKLKANMKLSQGEKFCEIGGHKENGGWPPHLHLQKIYDLEGNYGDYPGVCTAQKLPFYRNNCPTPSSLVSNTLS